MVNDNKTLINLTHVLAAGLMWLMAFLMFELFAGHFSVVARAWSNESVRHIIPAVLAVGVFGILRLNPTVVTFTDDVITELKKVTWPEPGMTWGLTWRVCIILCIAGIIVSLYDVFWAYIINLFVKG